MTDQERIAIDKLNLAIDKQNVALDRQRVIFDQYVVACKVLDVGLQAAWGVIKEFELILRDLLTAIVDEQELTAGECLCIKSQNYVCCGCRTTATIKRAQEYLARGEKETTT